LRLDLDRLPVTVRILGFEEIPAALLSQVASLNWSDNDPPFDLRAFRKARALGHPYAPYFGLLAVENGQVLSQVVVERPRLTTGTGTEAFSGIAGVVTRPDAQGRGLCSRLLEEVHRRERAQGLRWAFLWTRRSWRAHRIYERLGYRDVYSPPTALREVRRASNPRLRPGYSIRTATLRDAGALESILEESTRGRLGFVPRSARSFRARFSLGLSAPKDYHLLLHRSRPVGYFHASQSPFSVAAYEVAVRADDHLPAVLDGMQRYAAGRWLAVGYTTFVNDAAPLLRERGFTICPSSHAILMARNLGTTRSGRSPSFRELFSDPRFSCHRGDMF